MDTLSPRAYLPVAKAIGPAVIGYDPVAKTLHWLVVVLLAVQFAIGWIMPEIHRDTPNEGLIPWHLDVGMVTLGVALVRLAWRLVRPVPPAAVLPPWQVWAERLTHYLIYALLVVMPLLGWANASSRGYEVTLFGFPVPPLMAKGSPLGRELGDVHIFTSYVLLGAVGLHVAAALYHWLLLRDGVFERMWPGRISD